MSSEVASGGFLTSHARAREYPPIYVAVIIKLLAADRAQIWLIRASLPVTDCETVICRTGLRSRCPGIGCWSSQTRSAVRRYRPLRRDQRACLLRLVPLPRSSADSRDEDGPLAGRGHRSVNVGQEARFALAEFKFGAAGVAQQCTTVATVPIVSPVRVISQVAMYAVWS